MKVARIQGVNGPFTQRHKKMNWLFRKLGYRDREYRGDNFSVRIEQIVREEVLVIYDRHEVTANLPGERIGDRWEGIRVNIPSEIESERVFQIASDLEIAFQAMGYGYVIGRLGEVEIVPDTERQAAIAELHEMGYEIEVSADRKQVSQKMRPGAPRPDIDTARKQAPRMMSLIQAVRGQRQRFEILAKSKGF